MAVGRSFKLTANLCVFLCFYITFESEKVSSIKIIIISSVVLINHKARLGKNQGKRELLSVHN